MKQPTNLIPNREEAAIALEVLKAFAKAHCINPTYRNQVGDADLIQAALSNLIDHDNELTIAIAGNLIEDVNYHDLAARVRGEINILEWDTHDRTGLPNTHENDFLAG